MLSFTIPTKPIPKERPRFTLTKRGFRVFTPQRTIQFEKLVAQYALKARADAGLSLITAPLSLSITIKPDHITISVSPSPEPSWKPRADIDNIAKAISDALQGVIYQNDRQIIELHITIGDQL